LCDKPEQVQSAECSAYVPEFVGADAAKVADLASDLRQEIAYSNLRITQTNDSLTIKIDSETNESKKYADGLNESTRGWASSQLTFTAEAFRLELQTEITQTNSYTDWLNAETRLIASSQLELTASYLA
jgi:hypothetical protein